MRLFLTAFMVFLFVVALSANGPIVKFNFYMDSAIKKYNIEDMAGIDFIKSNLSFSMEIFIKGSINAYNVKDINSIDFIDTTKLQINLTGSSEIYNLAEIDSIIFIPNTCTEITIGTQTWMCKNLDVSTYRNGDTIPQITDPTEWVNLTTGAWCYYNNDPTYGAVYGKLYNWYAVNDPRGLAPEGWHIPSDTEWTVLSDYLGGSDVAGGKLKTIGNYQEGNGLWHSPNSDATNESGFSAVPGGWQWDNSEGIAYHCLVWSSTKHDYLEAAWNRHLSYKYTDFDREYNGIELGCSVRCVKD